MAIKDTKMGYVSTFLAQNEMTALRQFGDMTKTPGTLMGNHPEDFELYVVGDLDDQAGTIKPCNKYIARANEFTTKKEEKNNE